MPGIPSALASLSVGHTSMAAAAAAASRLGLSGLAPTAGHNVLLVSNLNPQVSAPPLRPPPPPPPHRHCVRTECSNVNELLHLLFMSPDRISERRPRCFGNAPAAPFFQDLSVFDQTCCVSDLPLLFFFAHCEFFKFIQRTNFFILKKTYHFIFFILSH